MLYSFHNQLKKYSFLNNFDNRAQVLIGSLLIQPTYHWFSPQLAHIIYSFLTSTQNLKVISKSPWGTSMFLSTTLSSDFPGWCRLPKNTFESPLVLSLHPRPIEIRAPFRCQGYNLSMFQKPQVKCQSCASFSAGSLRLRDLTLYIEIEETLS